MRGLVFLIFLTSCMVASAQNRVRVIGLSITGNTSTDAGLIRAHSGLSVGQEITGDDVQTALQQLWKLNLFSDIEIVEEREAADGVYMAIRVKEYPRLERLDVKGNRKLKGDDLNELLQLTNGQVIQPRDLVQLKNRLRRKYDEMGYRLAEIEIKTFGSPQTGRDIVDVTIKEGKKVKIRRIEFTGNNAFSDRALRGKFKDTKQKALLRSGNYKPEKIDEDQQLLVDFYRSKGYRDFEIASDSISYSDDRRWVFLNFTVSEGKLYRYGEFTWSGNKLFSTTDLATRMRIAPGDLYNGQKFQQSMADIGSKYYEKGYIYASVTPSEKVRADSLVDVHMDVVEGSEFKVNRIFVEGNTKTKDRVIRRELVLYPGETFDVTKLQRSIREVTILNYFGNITPDVVPINDNQVDLYLKVEEKSTEQANVSAGYSQRDGFIGSVGFQMNNLLGNGQQFSLDWNFGKTYRSFSISFTEPWFRNRRTLLGVSFFDTHRGGSYYGFDEDIIGGTVRIGQRVKWPDDYFRVDYIYRLDRTVYSNFTSDFEANNPRSLQEDVPRVSSSLTQIISRDSRDNPEFPTRGSVNSLRLELTGGPLAGDDKFVKANISNNWYLPVVGDLVLATNSEVGALDGLTRDPHNIPYFDYFFMGGAGLSLGTSLRGYDESEVGPQSGGYAVGGKTMFKQSAELRFPIVRNPTIFLLTFGEAGNVWRNFGETNFTDVRRSVGFGVRLFMPLVGMIGLDYGLGLDYTDSRGLKTTKWMPHFQFGRSF
ncbi:outer membrane protein assembly factor BamA [candidate division KSB1 bacterium]|nr:MAG: outer membrane protein assembly factor BamA [candidate division KSB1 bacterium]